MTELVEDLAANQPNVSKHLNLLLEGGLVARRKQGTSNIYSVADPLIFTLCDLVCKSATAKTKEELAALEKERPQVNVLLGNSASSQLKIAMTFSQLHLMPLYHHMVI